MDQIAPITRERIAATEAAIRPYVRRTPLVAADGADFGLSPGLLAFNDRTRSKMPAGHESDQTGRNHRYLDKARSPQFHKAARWN